MMTAVDCIDEDFGGAVSESEFLHQLFVTLDVPRLLFKNILLEDVTAIVQSHS